MVHAETDVLKTALCYLTLMHTAHTMADERQMWDAMRQEPREIIANDDILEAFGKQGKHTDVSLTLSEHMIEVFIDPECDHGISKYKCKECNPDRVCQEHKTVTNCKIWSNECIRCIYTSAEQTNDWQEFKDLWRRADTL